jgi:hypothetical protein
VPGLAGGLAWSAEAVLTPHAGAGAGTFSATKQSDLRAPDSLQTGGFSLDSASRGHRVPPPRFAASPVVESVRAAAGSVVEQQTVAGIAAMGQAGLVPSAPAAGGDSSMLGGGALQHGATAAASVPQQDAVAALARYVQELSELQRRELRAGPGPETPQLAQGVGSVVGEARDSVTSRQQAHRMSVVKGVGTVLNSLEVLTEEAVRTTVGAVPLFLQRFQELLRAATGIDCSLDSEDASTALLALCSNAKTSVVLWPLFDGECQRLRAETGDAGATPSFSAMRLVWQRGLGAASGTTQARLERLMAMHLGGPSSDSLRQYDGEWSACFEAVFPSNAFPDGEARQRCMAAWYLTSLPPGLRQQVEQLALGFDRAEFATWRAVRDSVQRVFDRHQHELGSGLRSFREVLREYGPLGSRWMVRPTARTDGGSYIPARPRVSQEAGRAGRDSGLRKCFRCSEVGHIQAECPRARVGTIGRAVRRFAGPEPAGPNSPGKSDRSVDRDQRRGDQGTHRRREAKAAAGYRVQADSESEGTVSVDNSSRRHDVREGGDEFGGSTKRSPGPEYTDRHISKKSRRQAQRARSVSLSQSDEESVSSHFLSLDRLLAAELRESGGRAGRDDDAVQRRSLVHTTFIGRAEDADASVVGVRESRRTSGQGLVQVRLTADAALDPEGDSGRPLAAGILRLRAVAMVARAGHDTAQAFPVVCVPDTGCDASVCVDRRLAEQLGLQDSGRTAKVSGVGEVSTGRWMSVGSQRSVRLLVLGTEVPLTEVLVCSLPEGVMLLGMPMVRSWSMAFSVHGATARPPGGQPVIICDARKGCLSEVLTTDGVPLDQTQAWPARVGARVEWAASLAEQGMLTEASSAPLVAQAILASDLAPDDGTQSAQGRQRMGSSPADDDVDFSRLGVGVPLDPDKPVGLQFSREEYAQRIRTACEGGGLTGSQQRKLRQLLLRPEFERVLRWDGLPANAPMKTRPVTIVLSADYPTGTRFTQRRITQEQTAALNVYLDSLLAAGVIEVCPSRPEQQFAERFNSPVLFVPKVRADGRQEWRVVHDFRALNAITVLWEAVIPDLLSMLEFVAEHGKFISKMDLAKAYHQLPIHRDDRYKTAFTTHRGRFMFRTCPLGPRNIPAEFCARLAEMLRPVEDVARSYFDDLAIATDGDFDEHLVALERVLTVCVNNGIIMSIDKCAFAQRKVNILGHSVSHQSIQMSDKARIALERLTPPASALELQRVLGIMGYWRRMICGFAELARPLHALLKSNSGFHWDYEHTVAFEAIRRALVTSKGLAAAIPVGRKGHGAFHIYTDASNHTIAGVVAQEHVAGGLSGEASARCVMCLSRALTDTEQRYCATDRELLAIRWTIAKVGVLLDGAVVNVYTDHQPLIPLLRSGCLASQDTVGVAGPRRIRWLAEIQAFNVQPHHRPGKSMCMRMVDAFTRLPLSDDPAAIPVDYVQARFRAPLDDGLGVPRIGPLDGVHPAAVPRVGDTADERPLGAVFRNEVSVLDERAVCVATLVRRSSRLRQAAGPAMGQASTAPASAPSVMGESGGEPHTSSATRGHAADGGVRTGGIEQLGHTVGGDAQLARLPVPVWHSEIWLSTAVWFTARTREMHPELPTRFHKRVTDDVRDYLFEFDERGQPTVIRLKRLVGEAPHLAERVFEVPAPARRADIAASAHLLGHRGVLKTCRLIESSGFTWVGITDDVALCVRGCEVCTRVNARATLHDGAIAIPVPSGVFDRVHMDLLKLPESDPVPGDGLRYQYVLLIVDALSKFPVAAPLVDKESRTVASALWDIVTVFGAPAVIVSDNGAEFVNTVVDGLSQLHGIERRVVTPYRPQANGQVERFNRSLIQILTKCTGSVSAAGQWPQWLPYVLMAIRVTVHAATGFTPHHVFFGRPARPLVDYQALAVWDQADLSVPTAELFASMAERLRRADAVRVSARTAAEGAQSAQRRAQDSSHRVAAARLPAGTWVRVLDERLENKLLFRFLGPFQVLSLAGEEATTHSGNYILADEEGRQLERSFPRDKLYVISKDDIAFTRRQAQLYSRDEWMDARVTVSEVQAGPLPVTKDPAGSGVKSDQTWWAVERVVGRRTSPRGVKEVKVKWVGYDEPEWVPEANMKPGSLEPLLKEWASAERLAAGVGQASRLRRRQPGAQATTRHNRVASDAE